MTSQERWAKEPSHVGETIINDRLHGVMPGINADNFSTIGRRLVSMIEEPVAFMTQLRSRKF